MTDKKFASQADLVEKTGQLRQALRARLRVHRRGRPQHRHRRRRRCGDGDRHAGHAGDGAGRRAPHPRGHRPADPPRRAFALPRGARAGRVGLRRAEHHREPRHLRSHRRARRGRHEERDRALSAPVSRRRVGARAHVADDRVRAAAVDAARARSRSRSCSSAAATPRATRSSGCRRRRSSSPAISSSMPRRLTPATPICPTGRRRSTRSRRCGPRSSSPDAARRCRRRATSRRDSTERGPSSPRCSPR